MNFLTGITGGGRVTEIGDITERELVAVSELERPQVSWQCRSGKQPGKRWWKPWDWEVGGVISWWNVGAGVRELPLL